MTDIYFAAYLIHMGHELKTFKLNENKYMSFSFGLSSEEMIVKKIEFLKSDYNKMKRQIIELKSLGK